MAGAFIFFNARPTLQGFFFMVIMFYRTITEKIHTIKIRANHHVYKISIKDDSGLNNASYVTVRNQPSNKPKYDKLTLTITKPKAKYRNLNGATTTRAVKVTHYVQKEGD